MTQNIFDLTVLVLFTCYCTYSVITIIYKTIRIKTGALNKILNCYNKIEAAENALEKWEEARPTAYWGNHLFVREQLLIMITSYEFILANSKELIATHKKLFEEELQQLYIRLYSNPPPEDPPNSGSLLLLNYYLTMIESLHLTRRCFES